MDVRRRELGHSTSSSPDCLFCSLLQIQAGNRGIPNHILLFGGTFCSLICSKDPRAPKPHVPQSPTYPKATKLLRASHKTPFSE